MTNSAGKSKREEELLTDSQKRTILEMWERDSDAPGAALGFIMERFSLWDLTPEAVKEIVSAERAKRRKSVDIATNWAMRYEDYRNSI